MKKRVKKRTMPFFDPLGYMQPQIVVTISPKTVEINEHLLFGMYINVDIQTHYRISKVPVPL